MIKKNLLKIIILIILHVQYSTQTPVPSTAPTDWVEGFFTSGCLTTLGGDLKIV